MSLKPYHIADFFTEGRYKVAQIGKEIFGSNIISVCLKDPKVLTDDVSIIRRQISADLLTRLDGSFQISCQSST
jgi:hypothetical protein